MRMHRGSSKGERAPRPSPEHLPLSASAEVTVEVEVARAKGPALHTRSVRVGTLVKEVVRSVGEAPEGTAVLVEGVSVPLDTPIDRAVRLVVVPTFSGG
jgi:sulfur carrier protein ThiS